MRLIDADALKEVLHGTMDWCDLIEVDKAIRDAPTIDPVKHGRWITEPYVGKHATLKILRCCECDNPVMALPSGKDYNYCPNCGARMDGGEE